MSRKLTVDWLVNVHGSRTASFVRLTIGLSHVHLPTGRCQAKERIPSFEERTSLPMKFKSVTVFTSSAVAGSSNVTKPYLPAHLPSETRSQRIPPFSSSGEGPCGGLPFGLVCLSICDYLTTSHRSKRLEEGLQLVLVRLSSPKISKNPDYSPPPHPSTVSLVESCLLARKPPKRRDSRGGRSGKITFQLMPPTKTVACFSLSVIIFCKEVSWCPRMNLPRKTDLTETAPFATPLPSLHHSLKNDSRAH